MILTCPGDATLPGQPPLATVAGANAPRIMLWNPATSRFVHVNVVSMTDLGGNSFYCVCTDPGFPLASGLIVSPDIGLSDTIATAVETYFDSLGPGPLFDADSDARAARCVRFPSASEERPFRAGQLVATRVIEALGGTSSDATAALDRTSPDFPTDLTLGPNMLTLGTCGIYPL